jgi:hypothetical protein
MDLIWHSKIKTFRAAPRPDPVVQSDVVVCVFVQAVNGQARPHRITIDIDQESRQAESRESGCR